MVSTAPPEGSGITFEQGVINLNRIPVLEKGGIRELFIPIKTDKNISEGEYVIRVEAKNSEGLYVKADAKLLIRWVLEQE